MKRLIILLCFVLTCILNVTVISAQSYDQIRNYDGFEIEEAEMDSLLSISNQIRNLEGDTETEIKVLSFGLYHINSFTPDLESLKSEVESISQVTSEFYISYGYYSDPQYDNYKPFFFINLPKTGKYECLDLVSETLREQIYDEVKFSYFRAFEEGFYSSQVIATKKLKEMLTTLFDCCETRNDTCQLSFLSPESFVERLLEEGFAITDLSRVITDYTEETRITNNQAQEFLLEVEDIFSNEIYDLDEFTNSIQETLTARLNDEVAIYKFRFPFNNTDAFNEVLLNYESDNSFFKELKVVVVLEDDICISLSKIGGNFASTQAKYSTLDSTDFYTQEQIFVNEAKGSSELGNVCDLQLKSILFRTASTSSSVYQFILSLLPQNEGTKSLKRFAQDIKETSDQITYLIDYEFWLAVEKEEGILNFRYEKEGLYCSSPKARARAIRYDAIISICGGTIQSLLDICGLVPVAGSICDVANAIVYFSKGEYGLAVLNVVGVIPLAGDGIKWTGKVFNTGLKKLKSCGSSGTRASGRSLGCALIQTYAKIGEKGVIYFGKRRYLKNLCEKYYDDLLAKTGATGKLTFRKFRKNLFEGVKIEWHHVIDWKNLDHSLLERLGKGRKFDPFDPGTNGLPLPAKFSDGKPFHSGSGAPSAGGGLNPYAEYIKRKLDKIEDLNIDDTMKSQEIAKLQDELKDLVEMAYNNTKSIREYFEKLL